MRKSYLFTMAFAAMLFTACSSEDVALDGGEVEGEGVTSYVAVSIRNAGGGATFAPSTRVGSDGGYEVGSDAENKVTNVRFYVFDANGNPYTFVTGTNYVDKPYDALTQGSTGSNVEEIGKAVLVIDGTTKEAPASIVAVLNPPVTLNSAIYSLDELRAQIDATAAKAEGEFIMSNSAYVNAAGTLVDAAIVTKDNVKTSMDEALKDPAPVQIYVERLLAKATANTEVQDEKFEVGEYDGKKVFAKVLGWQIADYQKQAYMIKHVNTSWTDADLGFAWSNPTQFRSYWAQTVPFSDNNVIGNYSFNAIDGNELGASIYTQENTPMAVISTPKAAGNGLSKFIVAAQLQNADGSALELCHWQGRDYVEIANVKTAIANNYKLTYYKKDGQNLVSLAPDDYTFVADATVATNYQAIPKLANESVEVYTPAADGEVTDANGKKYTKVAVADVNNALKIYPAQIRRDGYTYYYIPVAHLGAAGKLGQYGIVRNHVYKINITSIAGFGTPVYDPNQTIIPAIPTAEEKSYVSAQINILSWKVVNQNVDLDSNQ